MKYIPPGGRQVQYTRGLGMARYHCPSLRVTPHAANVFVRTSMRSQMRCFGVTHERATQIVEVGMEENSDLRQNGKIGRLNIISVVCLCVGLVDWMVGWASDFIADCRCQAGYELSHKLFISTMGSS